MIEEVGGFECWRWGARFARRWRLFLVRRKSKSYFDLIILGYIIFLPGFISLKQMNLVLFNCLSQILIKESLAVIRLLEFLLFISATLWISSECPELNWSTDLKVLMSYTKMNSKTATKMYWESKIMNGNWTPRWLPICKSCFKLIYLISARVSRLQILIVESNAEESKYFSLENSMWFIYSWCPEGYKKWGTL